MGAIGVVRGLGCISETRGFLVAPGIAGELRGTRQKKGTTITTASDKRNDIK